MTIKRAAGRPQATSENWIDDKPWLAALLLALLAFAVYQKIWHAGYIWDDDYYVTGNRTLRDLHGLWRIWFEVTATPQYYPLVHSSFWLEYHVWALNPLGYHLINVALHGLGAILLWRCLLLLRVPGAWLAGAIFAVHPVMVESVAWITERKNVLSTVFYFSSSLAYLRYVGFGSATESLATRRGWLWLSALGLFVLALLSKTAACTLPAALVIIAWWKNGRLRKQDIIPLLPFFAVGLCFGLLTAWLEKHHVRAEGDEFAFTFLQRVLIAGRAVCFYAAKLIWPTKLTFIYPRWQVSIGIFWQWLFPAGSVAVVAALWLLRNRIGRGPLAAVLFFICTLGPALGFVNVFPFRYSFVADHFQYLASVGLFALAATGLARLPRVIPALLLVFLGVLSWSQARIYQNLETLWDDTLRKNPQSWMVQNSVAGVLLNKGQIDQAMKHYDLALQYNPDNVVTQNGLGYVYLMQGKVGDSLIHLRRALELVPGYPAAHFNLANTYLQMGRTADALRELQETLVLDPNDPEAEKNMAWVLATNPDPLLRDGEKALALAQAANSLQGPDPTYLATVAAAYAENGRFSEAIAAAERAMQLANTSGNQRLIALLAAQLDLYRSGRAYRDVR